MSVKFALKFQLIVEQIANNHRIYFFATLLRWIPGVHLRTSSDLLIVLQCCLLCSLFYIDFYYLLPFHIFILMAAFIHAL